MCAGVQCVVTDVAAVDMSAPRSPAAAAALALAVFALCLDAVLAAQSSYVLETPEYILPCSRSDPKLNDCVKRLFNHLRPYLIRGIPEIEVPPVEPLSINKLYMENGHGPVRVRAAFNNVTAFGASNYSINNVKADVAHWKIELHLTIPRIEVKGQYEVTGNVLLFPVRSKGDFWAAFSDIKSVATINGHEIVQDGIKFLKIQSIGADFALGKSRFKIRDVINKSSILGEAMNRFLNENADVIIEEMKPAAAASISRHFTGFLNKAFLKIPVSIWLTE